MTSKVLSAAAAAFVVLAPALAEAAIIRVDFSGVQTGGTVSLPDGPASISAWFTYDDQAPNTAAPGAGYSAFVPSVGVFGVSTGAGGVCSGSFDGLGQIFVRDDVSTSVGLRDVVSGVGISPLGCLSTLATSVRLILSGPSTSWSDSAPSFDKWTDADLNFGQIALARSDGTQAFVFNVNAVSAAPVNVVPVPAAAPLFLLGIAAFARLRRARR